VEVWPNTTTSVDNYPSGTSPYGVQDLIGNAFEWTNSIYERYPYQPDDGRETHFNTYPEPRTRVVRGCAWNGHAEYGEARAAQRRENQGNVVALAGQGGIGFRLACPVSVT
jgi:formylglycine-generating enzyme required for sulfatase activity